MRTQHIRALPARATQADAVEAFRRRWLSTEPLRRVALVYVPFLLYSVAITNRGKVETKLIAADEVTGALDPYQFDAMPELAGVETRNVVPGSLAAARAAQLVENKVRRVIFQTGFFRVRALTVKAQSAPMRLHVPYWLGFHGTDERVSVRVLDAVRRTKEGGKARALFEDWLRDDPDSHGAVARAVVPAVSRDL